MPKRDWTKENMEYAMCFFPLVGAVIGVVSWLWVGICTYFDIGSMLFAAGMTLIPIAISGGIHLDGFCDTMDALSSRQPRERKLEILKDSNVGAFALMGCVLYLLVVFALFTEFPRTGYGCAVLGCGFVLSRSFSGISVVSFQNAKKTGTLATFSDMAKKKKVQVVLGIDVVLCFALFFYIDIVTGITLAVLTATVFGYYRWISYKEFGGITGDLAGYFLQLCELGILIGIVGIAIVQR